MRKFGIELEMVGPAQARGDALSYTARLIAGAGVQAIAASYSGRNYTVWQCKSDSSITPHDRAVEVVSPIMSAYPDSYAVVAGVVTRLDGDGYGINRSCGFHVHIDVSDLTLQERMLVVLRYAQMQGEINAMLPPSRRSNSYCAPLRDRPALEAAIDGNRANWRVGHGRASESVNTAFIHDTRARLEFRQAAGTCNAGKVTGWVAFLQEFIDEVVRRARAVTVGRPGVTPAYRPGLDYRPPAARPLNPLAMMPRMRVGSDQERALRQLCEHGVVTTQWAIGAGIGANVLRRIIVGFRRHGAPLRTVPTVPGLPEYHLVGIAVPCTARAIFQPATVAPAPVAPVVAPAPVAGPAAVTAYALVDYPLAAGLSPATLAWCADRRDTFSADNVA